MRLKLTQNEDLFIDQGNTTLGNKHQINGGGVDEELGLYQAVQYLLQFTDFYKEWEKQIPIRNYLTFEAVEDATFTFSNSGLSYSTDDGNTWASLAANTATPTVSAGNKILFKGEMTPSDEGIGEFSSTGKFNASGNIMSLLYGDNFIGQTDLTGKDWAFGYIFNENTGLIDAGSMALPATTLADSCYNNMFYHCTSLTTAPELPATTLANGCYNGMFNGCTSLTAATELPATTLADSCYNNMFYHCTSLTTAPELPATTLANGCYNGMFAGCTALTTATELPATTLAGSCYANMFANCFSLETAPSLPATTLVNNCYEFMFSHCTKVNRIKAMFTTTPSLTYTNSWVWGISSTGTFVKNSAATWDVTGNNGIPTGWTVETASA